jgi:hypothetical protein
MFTAVEEMFELKLVVVVAAGSDCSMAAEGGTVHAPC